MKYFFNRIISSLLPSRDGREALENLQRDLEDPINFNIRKVEDESGKYLVAKSTNTGRKYIVTAGKDPIELDKHIKDAIFTAYKVPSIYCNYSLIKSGRERSRELQYATA